MPASANIFMARENPRHLFVRDPLPCTQAASDTQAAPSQQQQVQRQQGLSQAGVVPGDAQHAGLASPSGIQENGAGMRHELGRAHQAQPLSEEQVLPPVPRVPERCRPVAFLPASGCQWRMICLVSLRLLAVCTGRAHASPAQRHMRLANTAQPGTACCYGTVRPGLAGTGEQSSL